MSRPKALFIGQAPPQQQVALPFGRTHLYKWLASVGIDQDTALREFAFTALTQEFPGKSGRGDLVPTPEILQKDRPLLLKLIARLHPPVIVPVGVLSIREILNNEKLTLKDVIGQRFQAKPFGLEQLQAVTIIPLPHPSGASSWQYMDNNKQLLGQALTLLAHEASLLDTP
jgi:uracil-DNA glycosylase